MQFFVTLNEAIRELLDFKFLKMSQNLYANIEGFTEPSIIISYTVTQQWLLIDVRIVYIRNGNVV